MVILTNHVPVPRFAGAGCLTPLLIHGLIIPEQFALSKSHICEIGAREKRVEFVLKNCDYFFST